MKEKQFPPPKTDKRDGWLKKLLRWISKGNKKAYKNGCPT